MARDLIRIMNVLFLPAAEAPRQPAWAPAADVYHTHDGWLVKFELAGVRAEDITLEVGGNRLTVRGVRRDCVPEEWCRCYQMEIAYSHFERTVQLPSRLERARLLTDYRDGMLLVHIRTEE